MKKLLLVVTLFLAAALLHGGCIPVLGDDVLLSDLLPGIPGPATSILKSPLWPISRKLTPLERKRILTLAPDAHMEADLCVERPSQSLTDVQLLQVLRSSFPEVVGAEMLDGPLSLPAGGLQIQRVTATQGGLWLVEGQVRYGTRSVYHTAIRARLRWRFEALAATRDLTPGALLEAGDLVATTVESGQRPPTASVDTWWIGGRLKRNLAAGSPLGPADFLAPNIVEPGDTITMEIQCGGASLSITAVALNRASIGAPIKARTPAGRQLQGRLVSKQKGLIRVAL